MLKTNELNEEIKKIIYMSFNDPYKSPGVYKKELNFCNMFGKICKEYGIEFKGFNIVFFNGKNKIEDTDYLQFINVRTNIKNKFINFILINKYFLREAQSLVKTYKPDLLLMRYSTTRLILPFNPKKYNDKLIFVSEHQTKEIEEMKSNIIDRMFIPLEILKSKIFFKNVEGIIGVTKEIAEYEIKRARKNIPYFVLTNGINVDSYPLKSYIPFSGKELNILFVASNTSRWHGLDRLLQGLYNYRGIVNIKLNVVGEVTKDILEMSSSLGLRNNVVFHGIKLGKELDELYDISHIAIGSLGIHRKGLKYASTLKVREYMARGIPFIISHIDEDIDNDFPFCLRVPDNDEPIDMDLILKFTENIYKSYVDFPQIMRKYAVERMDYKVKFKKFIDFIIQFKK